MLLHPIEMSKSFDHFDMTYWPYYIRADCGLIESKAGYEVMMKLTHSNSYCTDNETDTIRMDNPEGFEHVPTINRKHITKKKTSTYILSTHYFLQFFSFYLFQSKIKCLRYVCMLWLMPGRSLSMNALNGESSYQ